MTISSPRRPTDEAPIRKPMQIDVWSDLACPWCYVGKHRLDQAIKSSPHAEAIAVRIHSFELDPSMGHEAKPNLEVVAAKYGLTPDQAREMDGKVAAVTQADGLPFDADRVLANSFDVHRVLQIAATFDLDDQLLGVLQRTLFGGEADVYDHAVLAEAATEIGIPRPRVEEVLSSDEYADAVRADESEARDLGIAGVPFTLLDGRLAIPGSTTVEGFASAIDQAWSER